MCLFEMCITKVTRDYRYPFICLNNKNAFRINRFCNISKCSCQLMRKFIRRWQGDPRHSCGGGIASCTHGAWGRSVARRCELVLCDSTSPFSFPVFTCCARITVYTYAPNAEGRPLTEVKRFRCVTLRRCIACQEIGRA